MEGKIKRICGYCQRELTPKPCKADDPANGKTSHTICNKCVDFIEVVDRFEAAVEAHAWMGSQHPNDFKPIETEYEQARAALYRRITE